MYSSDLNAMVDAVIDYHERLGFDVGTENKNTMLYRMNLLIEELGGISKCLTKPTIDNMAEKHAQLFILLLGNCITMNIDIVEEFWKKYYQLMDNNTNIWSDEA